MTNIFHHSKSFSIQVFSIPPTSNLSYRFFERSALSLCTAKSTKPLQTRKVSSCKLHVFRLYFNSLLFDDGMLSTGLLFLLSFFTPLWSEMRNRNLNLILRSFRTFRSTFDGLDFLINAPRKPWKCLVCLSYFLIFFTFYFLLGPSSYC